MNNPLIGRTLLALMIAALWGEPLAAQTTKTRVDLGGNTITIGPESKNTTSLVLSLWTDSDAKVTDVSSEIELPAQHVSFIKGSAKIEGDRYEAKVEPNPEDADSFRLRVTVSAQTRPWLSSGVLAELEFMISATTPDGLLEFPVSSRVTFDDSPALENVGGDPGMIAVSSTGPVISGCFFFMH